MTDDLERLLAAEAPPAGGGDEGIRIIGLGLGGRHDEARQRVIAMRQAMRLPAFEAWTDYLMAWLDRRPADMHVTISGLSELRIQQDPEAIFLEGWLQCEVGAHEGGLEYLQRAVAKGYYVAPTLARSRHFDALRALPAFRALVAQAEAGRAARAGRVSRSRRRTPAREARGSRGRMKINSHRQWSCPCQHVLRSRASRSC